MKQRSTSESWSRIACRYLGKTVGLVSLCFVLATGAYAQGVTAEQKERQQSLFHILNKRAYTGEYPLPKLPMATESVRRAAHDASGQPLNFPDRVWFPGEWEEVKAVVVSPLYHHYVPGYEDDPHYEATPLVEGHAIYYFKQTPTSTPGLVGKGPYVTKLDVTTANGMPLLYLMDGIQQAGVEAWVRIERATDEQLIRNAMQYYGLRNDKMRFFVSGGNSYWFRDCGPICFYYGDDDKLAMLDFFYGSTRSLDDLLPSVLHRKMGIPNYKTNLVWEGGNCLVDGAGGLVTSSAVYDNNTDTIGPVVWDGKDFGTISYSKKDSLDPKQVDAALIGMLGQSSLWVLQRLKHEGGTGHVDLYADAIDENGFLFTKMPDQYSNWTDYGIANDNISYMYKQSSFWDKYYDMGRLPFPSRDDGSNFESETEYGEYYSRTYANHLLLNNYILQPCFSPVGDDGMPTAAWDRANIEAIKKLYPGYTFYCIDMRTFDGSGGSIHCITKQIPADNPIRILHMHLHGHIGLGELTEVPFRAIITNKSGIKSAQLVYSVGGGDWKMLELTGNGNSWWGRLPVSSLVNGQTVEYYIQATSNNGKTITKPVNAVHGAYFSFTPDNTLAYDNNVFDFGVDPVAKDKITFQLDTKWLTEDTTTDTPSAISNVTFGNEEHADNTWYTLDGCRLSARPSAKGVYIHQGKKVVLR